MVQEKRHAVDFVAPPQTMDGEAEIWEILETGEIFPMYEQYLMRRDYYNQKIFTNQISGNTNLTFWEAYKSETQGGKDVDRAFPDPLREPILRKVQFSTTPRIDELVTSLFATFDRDIHAGERVIVFPTDQKYRREGIVRDKAIFSATSDRPEMVRFFVRLPKEDGREAVVDSEHVMRYPRSFTKQVLRSFLKHTIMRDRKDGSPWIVKEDIANAYNIPTQLPPELNPDVIQAERKAKAEMKKLRTLKQRNTSKESETPQGKAATALSAKAAARPRALGGQFQEISFAQPEAQPSPPVKYPIEDTQLNPRRDKGSRPPLKFLTTRNLFPTDDAWKGRQVIEMSTVGPLLEIWNTLTVFGQFFVLDGFTFDDFVGAMFIDSDQVPCQLFCEVHCSVLKMLVDDQGTILARSLKDVPDDESFINTSDDGSKSDSPAQEISSRTPRKKPKGLSHTGENIQLNGIGPKPMGHRVEDVLEEDEWIERLQRREFRNGGWEVIMLGLIEQLSLKPAHKTICERIMRHLAPADQGASQAVVQRQYFSMDINLRVAALQLATMYTLETKPFKDHMEECMREATETRKTKIQVQSEKKTLVAKLAELEQQRRLLRPDNWSGSPEPREEPPSNMDMIGSRSEDHHIHDSYEEDECSDSNQKSSDDSESEEDDLEEIESKTPARRVSDRTASLKRKREDLGGESVKQSDGKKKHLPNSKEAEDYKKILDEIEEVKDGIRSFEEQISGYEDELRENAAHRTKLLGKDRFFNHYYWFERNGMSFGGDPESSTAAYGYANGRLWVHGADKLETEGIVDLDSRDDKHYRQHFGMTINDRKNLELGPMQLASADQYGFYESPDDLDGLIAWLDNRGERERALRKELNLWRREISGSMEKRKMHIGQIIEKHAASEERVIGIATRKKTTVDTNLTKYPCTNWHNSCAIQKYGQLHIDGLVPKRSRKKTEAKLKEASAVPEKRTTRQGTRYTR